MTNCDYCPDDAERYSGDEFTAAGGDAA